MNRLELYRESKFIPRPTAGNNFTSKSCGRRTFERRIYTRRKIERSYYDRRACGRRSCERRNFERRVASVSIEFDESRTADRRSLPDFV